MKEADLMSETWKKIQKKYNKDLHLPKALANAERCTILSRQQSNLNCCQDNNVGNAAAIFCKAKGPSTSKLSYKLYL